MRRKFSLLMLVLIILFFSLSYTYAEGESSIVQQKRMAISRLKESGLTKEEAETYTMYLQIALGQATQFEIVDYAVTASLLKERGGTLVCGDLQCEIVNGQLLNVDYMCFGHIETIGKTFSLNVQVADVWTGRVVANISKFFKGKEKVFVEKVIPNIAKQIAVTIVGKIKPVEKSKKKENILAIESDIEQQAQQSFGDVRRYLSYGTEDDIETSGKLAFGYFATGKKLDPDDVLRYSYQLQSYLADVGACAMLYIDEMERLMKIRGGNLQCATLKCAMNAGRLLGVDYMGYGKIDKICRKLVARVYIIEVESGKVIADVKQSFGGKDIVFLTEVIPQMAYKIGEILERRNRASR
ncbi:MAG: hypothetical protein N2053_08580 [Chitinispirillaceae bacterium]|nr:hypothetical protein [Chitinispirillaceae bacterium]